MALAASFVVIAGLPFVLGVALGQIPMRWPRKLALGASLPVALALALFAGSPFSLVDDLGISFIALVASFGWLFGFALAADVRRLWRVLTR
jgi:hypothetical protein